ncbi:hypothetical protein TNCV_4645381 [Trichonephila clavipes]|nr:hypothetical protein TNCV_4645381 [Trichonephila clavipes]
MDVLLFGCTGKGIQRGGNRIIECLLGHQNLVERRSFRATIEGTGRRRIARTPIFEEGVLYAVDQTPSTSVRALAASTGRSPTTIHHVLQGAALHPFHVQRVQSL